MVMFTLVSCGQRSKEFDETFLMTDTLQHWYRNRLADKSGDTHTTTEWSDDKLKVHENSTCPWVYRTVHNKNRLPTTHIEAECLNTMCLALSHHSADPKALQSENFQKDSICLGVKYARWVRQRDNENSKYKRRLLTITVGCSCSRNN
ncbi:hypothetical protein Btru_032105 [Bulinus truncatus]|nr:hypothetical protein Btru_032105 [Bulinus truncatus]